MIFRFLLLSALAASSSAASENEQCSSNMDCDGNLDCVRVGSFRQKRCLPVSCIEGAVFALQDEGGFDATEWLQTIKTQGFGSGGFGSDVKMFYDGDKRHTALTKALMENRPPMEIFKSNYTRCLNPSISHRALEDDIVFMKGDGYGVQWSLAGVFAYIGKFSIWAWEDDFNGFFFRLTQNCLGAILGFDFGIDFLITIGNNGNLKTEAPSAAPTGAPRLLEEEVAAAPSMSPVLRHLQDDAEAKQLNLTGSAEGSVECSTCIPIITLACFGYQICWWNSEGTDEIWHEITVGASMGVSLGAGMGCWNNYQVDFTNF